MGIDIDSFLEKYNSEAKKENNVKIENKVNLDFQKDVEDKILKVENKIKIDNQFEVLEEIYNEIKKFDEDIPNKFLGIKNKGNIALKNIGEKYSKEFLSRVKENNQIINSNIVTQFKILDEKLNTNNFNSIITEFEILQKLFEKYPREFLKEKLILTTELRKREIIINMKINEYKNIELKELKIKINKNILELNKSLIPENINSIENKILMVQNLLKNIPKIFLTELTSEKIIISKALINAEKYLELEYLNDFQKKEKNLSILFEKYHSAYIDKDLSKTLILYEEILLEFESLPEVFFERKMVIYEKTNELYTMINDLFIKNNLSILVQSYNLGQLFKQTREYLNHIESTSELNIETLIKLETKLKSLPEKCEPEKSNLLKKIYQIKLKHNKKIDGENILEEKLNTNNNEIKDENKLISEEKLIHNKKNEAIKEVLKEMNRHYNILKENKNPKELENSYNKIIFYLNTLNLKHEVKKEILQKINNVLKLKITK